MASSPTQEPSPTNTTNDQQEATVTNANHGEGASRGLIDDVNKQEAFPAADAGNKEEALLIDAGVNQEIIPADDTTKKIEEISLLGTSQQENVPTNFNEKQEVSSVPIEGSDWLQYISSTFTDTEWWEEAIPSNTDEKQEANPNGGDKANPIDVHQEKEANPNNVNQGSNVRGDKQKGVGNGEKDQEEGVPHREENVVFDDNQGVISVPTTDDQETILSQEDPTSSSSFEPTLSTRFHCIPFEENYITVTVTNENESVDQWIDSIKITHEDRLQELLIGLYIELVPPEEAKAPWRDLATLQLCVGKECLVFQLQQAGKTMSIKLRHFLYTGGYTFVSPSIDAQERKLQELDLYVAKRVDLCQLAAYRRRDLEIYQTDGIEKLARAILQKEYKKPPEVKFYPWQEVLSEEQAKYACLDAYLCYEIGKALDAYEFRVQTRYHLSHILGPSSCGGSSWP